MDQEFRFCSKRNIKLLNASSEKDVEFYAFIDEVNTFSGGKEDTFIFLNFTIFY